MKRTGRGLAILLALAMLLSVSAFAAWNGIGGAWDTHNGKVTTAPTDAAPTVAKIAMKNSGSGWDGIDNVPVMHTVGNTTYAYVLYDGHAAGARLAKINCNKAIENASSSDLYNNAEVVLWDVPVSTKSGFQLSTPLLVEGTNASSEADDTLYIGLSTATALVEANASDSIWTVSDNCTRDGSKLKISSTGTYTMSTSNITMLKNNTHRAATGIGIPTGAEMTITAKVNDTVVLTKTFDSDDVIDDHFYLNDVFTSDGEKAVVAGSTNTLSFTFVVTALSGDAYIEYGSLFQTAASVMSFENLTSAPAISSVTGIATPTHSVNLNESGQLNTPITTDGTYIYFGTWQGDKSYYQWEPKDGDLKSVSGEGFYWAGAAVIGEQVFFGSDNGKLYWRDTSDFDADVAAIDLSTVNAQETVTAGNVRSSIMVDGDYFYFTSQGKYLWCFKANASGAPTYQWRTSLNAVSTSTPTKVGNKIYVGYYNGFNKGGVTEVTESRTASASSYVSKCDLIDGTGSTANNMPVQSSLVVLPNADSSAAAYVYFSTNSNVGAGYGYAVNGTTATKVWDTSAAGNGTYALGGMASDGGYMVFGNDYNYLYIVK